LRHETFDYLAKRVVVIKLDIYAESDFDPKEHEMNIAAIPFLHVASDLDTDKTISLRTTSVHMRLELANEGSTHRSLLSYVHSVVTCIYEYRTFRKLVQELEEAAEAHLLQQVTVTFTNRNTCSDQDSDILAMLDTLNLIRGVPNVNFFGDKSISPDRMNYCQMVARNMQRSSFVEAHMLEQSLQGFIPFEADARLLGIYQRIVQAMEVIYWGRGNKSEALQELRLVEAKLKGARAQSDELDDELVHDFARYASDCCKLLIKKIFLLILGEADREQKLAAIPGREVERILNSEDDELGHRHTQAFRAEQSAVSAISKLWRKRYREACGSPGSFEYRIELLEEAADEAARAVAMSHTESTALKALEQLCLRVAKRERLPRPILPNGMGCLTVEKENDDPREVDVEWQAAFPDEVAAEGRYSVWFGYQPEAEDVDAPYEFIVEDDFVDAAATTFEDMEEGRMSMAAVLRLSSIVFGVRLSVPVDIHDPYTAPKAVWEDVPARPTSFSATDRTPWLNGKWNY
jgi:hypothetical protein